MNEAFSDMAGEAAEYFMHGSNDSGGRADHEGRRRAALHEQSAADGASIDNASASIQPRRAYSSGVYNKAFYLLATKAGWDTARHSRRSPGQPALLDAECRLNQGACGVQTAAGDLGYAVADVTAAFTAGRTCGLPMSPPIEIDGAR